MFLADRKGKRDGKITPRWHVGVDLFANVGDPVVACEDGRIVNFSYFYPAKSGQKTYKLLVEHSKVVVNYGEVTSNSLTDNNLKEGSLVKAGQDIGFVSDTSMLHFETYTKGTVTSHRWWKDEKKPPRELLNPTKYLLFLQEHGLVGSGTKGQSAPSVPSTGQTIDLDRAVRANRRYGEQLGWQPHFDRIVRLLRFTTYTPDERTFAEAVARWQQSQGLTADGIIGPNTWSRMQSAMDLVPSTAPPGGLLGFSRAEEKALRITNAFENTAFYSRRRALNFGGLAGNFDGQGLSFGLLQWNIGTGSLQPLLREFERAHPQRFNATFGPDAAQLRRVLGQSTPEQLAWARSLNDAGLRIREPWRSYFEQLAEDPAFQQIQLQEVRPRMNRAADYARQFGLRSERGLALMFDFVTQQGTGWLDSRRCTGCREQTRRSKIQQRLTEFQQQSGRPPTEREVLEIMANVVADTSSSRWRDQVRVRKTTIVEGRGRVHGHDFDLEREFGLTD